MQFQNNTESVCERKRRFYQIKKLYNQTMITIINSIDESNQLYKRLYDIYQKHNLWF